MKKLLILLLILIPISTQATWAPLKKVGNPEQDEAIRYAWSISQDPNWIMTLERESGFYLKARNVNYNNSIDSGLCQLNSTYHWRFINSPEFQDYRHQLLYCAEVYSRNKNAFYGHAKRLQVKDRFVWFNN